LKRATWSRCYFLGVGRWVLVVLSWCPLGSHTRQSRGAQ
jgi:hypothetical protein